MGLGRGDLPVARDAAVSCSPGLTGAVALPFLASGLTVSELSKPCGSATSKFAELLMP